MANRCAVGGGSLNKASPAIERAGVGRSIPIHFPSPTTSVPGTIWCTHRVVALLSQGQGNHQPCDLVSQLHSVIN